MNRPLLLLAAALLLLTPRCGLGHGITNIVFDPVSPAEVELEEHVDVTFDYTTEEAGGVRIWCDTDNGNQMTSPSPLHPVGSGSGSTWFTILGAEATITSFRLYMMDATGTQLLYETTVVVDYDFVEPMAVDRSSWGRIKTLYR
jgi:hypothetical protein